MRPFLHARLAKWRSLLDQSNATLVKYNRLDLDLAPALTAFLDRAVETYKGLQRSEGENRLLAAKARFVTALQGIDPLRYEPVNTRRRSMQRTVALHVLQEASAQVRDDHRVDRELLEIALEELRPSVLTALERGWIPALPLDQARLEELWRRLLREAETRPVTRALELRLNVADILLLLEQLVVETSREDVPT